MTLDNFNYTSVVMLGTMLFASLYWRFGSIKERFNGPQELAPHENEDPFELEPKYGIN